MTQTRPLPARPGPGAPAARLAEILRVDQAGELGAVHIYRGQRAVFARAKGRARIADQLQTMQAQEAAHRGLLADQYGGHHSSVTGVAGGQQDVVGERVHRSTGCTGSSPGGLRQ